MAKRRGRPPGRGKATQAAESFGAMLGKVAAKVDAWMSQREEIARELREVADSVMAGKNPFGESVTTPSMLATELVGGKPRKRRTMSAAAREKIAAAQRARWARQKKAGK